MNHRSVAEDKMATADLECCGGWRLRSLCTRTLARDDHVAVLRPSASLARDWAVHLMRLTFDCGRVVLSSGLIARRKPMTVSVSPLVGRYVHGVSPLRHPCWFSSTPRSFSSVSIAHIASKDYKKLSDSPSLQSLSSDIN